MRDRGMRDREAKGQEFVGSSFSCWERAGVTAQAAGLLYEREPNQGQWVLTVARIHNIIHVFNPTIAELSIDLARVRFLQLYFAITRRVIDAKSPSPLRQTISQRRVLRSVSQCQHGFRAN